MSRFRTASPYLLAALLTATGAAHFAFPSPYDRIIPGFVPGPPRVWTYGSGLVEWACAASVALPASRRGGGLATAALFVAVFPANVEQALHTSGPGRWLALARLPVQLPLVLWALSVRRPPLSAPDGRAGSPSPAR